MSRIKKHKNLFIYGGVIIALLAVIIIAWTWLYSGKLTPAKINVYKITWLPAASVDSHLISMSRLIDRYNLLTHVQGSKANINKDPNLIDTILDKLITDKKLDILAKAKGVKVTDQTLSNLYDQMAAELAGGDSEKLELAITTYSGLSKNDFQEQVLKTSLVERGLQAWYFGQKELNPNLYKTAQKIMDEAEAGQDFATLASLHSSDNATASFSGDSGFVEEKSLAPEVSEGTKDSKLNEILLIPGIDGVHIVKILGRDTDGTNNAKRVRLQHIYIKGDGYTQWFKQQTDSFKVINLSTRLSF